MKPESSTRRIKPLMLLLVLVLAIASLTAVAVFVGLEGELIAFATIGTALGTLGLAFYTFQMAKSTRASIESSAFQLAEIRNQGKTLADQAEASVRLAISTNEMAIAARESAVAAGQMRTDQIAPMVNLVVSGNSLFVRKVPGESYVAMSEGSEWWVPEASKFVFLVPLTFRFQNVGATPAQLELNGPFANFHSVANGGGSRIVLAPGVEHVDELNVFFSLEEGIAGKLLGVPLTYDGIILGEVFDHIQWNGWITPLLEENGRVRRNTSRFFVSSAGAQIVRSYPNLERPREMEIARERLMNPFVQVGEKDPASE